MTAQVKLCGRCVIVTIQTYCVVVLMNYSGALSIKESGFEIAFPQILGHFRTKNSNIATKKFLSSSYKY